MVDVVADVLIAAITSMIVFAAVIIVSVDLSFLAAAGHTIIIRGCAPFTSEVFSPAMARSIGGNYWRRSNVFSFCPHDECNRGSLATSTPSILLLLLLSALLARAAPVQL